MSKTVVVALVALIALFYAIFFWYPDSDLIVRQHRSIHHLKSRGWVTLDRNLFEGSSEIRSAADLDSNDYIISIVLNKKQINRIYSYLLELKCKEKEVSSKKLEPLTDHVVADYPIVAFLHGRECGVQGKWLLDREKGLVVSTSILPFDSRVLRAYREKFL